jgi:hypothetical protein
MKVEGGAIHEPHLVSMFWLMGATSGTHRRVVGGGIGREVVAARRVPEQSSACSRFRSGPRVVSKRDLLGIDVGAGIHAVGGVVVEVLLKIRTETRSGGPAERIAMLHE